MKIKNPISFLVLLFLCSTVHAQYGKFKQVEADSVKVGNKWYKKIIDNLNDAIKGGSKLDGSATIDAGDSSLAFQAGSFTIKGKGLKTKFGVINGGNNSLTPTIARLLGFPVARSSWVYPNPTVPFANMAYFNQDLEILPTINEVPLDKSRQFLTADSVDNYFIPTAKTVLDTTKTRNIKTYLLDNEEVNENYRPLDSVETPKRYIYALNAYTDLMHSYGKKVANGGFTGQAPLWFVWYDLYYTQNDTARAGQYARAVFLPSQIASLSTWPVTGSRVMEIAIYRQLIAAYKTMKFDYFNIHWTEPRNGVDSVHAQTNAILWTIDYYRRVIGKPVICQELGSHSMQGSLMSEMMDVWASTNAEYVLPYSGTAIVTNATGGGEDVTLTNADNTLNAIGAAANTKYTLLKNTLRDLLKTNNGTVTFPYMADGAAHPMWIDKDGNAFFGSSTSSADGDTTYVVPYSTLLRFSKKKMSLPHTQASPEIFSLASDSAVVGKIIKLTVVGNGDSLKFPASFIWKNNILPQFDRTNDFTFTYRADGNVDAEVSTRNANYSNLIPITGQTSFLTYAGYQWTDWNIQPNADITVYAGTVPGGNDIMLPEAIQGGVNTTLHPNIKFDTPTMVYLTGVPTTAIQSINNSGLNKY